MQVVLNVRAVPDGLRCVWNGSRATAGALVMGGEVQAPYLIVDNCDAAYAMAKAAGAEMVLVRG